MKRKLVLVGLMASLGAAYACGESDNNTGTGSDAGGTIPKADAATTNKDGGGESPDASSTADSGTRADSASADTGAGGDGATTGDATGGDASTDAATTDGASPTDAATDAATPFDGGLCPPADAGATLTLSAAFKTGYQVAALGAIPGVVTPLGGCAVKQGAPNKLLMAFASESASGALYEIGVTRDACGHISGYTGSPAKLVDVPNIDAQLIYAGTTLLMSRFNSNLVSTLPNTVAPLGPTLALTGAGTVGSVGGLAFVPPGFAKAGELRALTYSQSNFYGVTFTSLDAGADAGFATASAALLRTLSGSGFMTYVPGGSPGVTATSLVVAEYGLGTLAIYDLDASAVPVLASRRVVASIGNPWGGCQDPVTGDILVAPWSSGPYYSVQGFAPPPAPAKPLFP